MLKILKEKKDDKWYEEIRDIYLKSAGSFSVRPDFNEKHNLYKFFNNDLSGYMDELNKICNDALTQDVAQEELLAYNKIRNKYDILDGTLLRRGNNHKIILLSAKAVKQKNDKLLKAIQENVEKDLQLIMSRAIDTLSNMTNEELSQFIEQERQSLTPRDIKYKNFLSDVEIYKSKMLRHIYSTDEILSKKRETFQHQFIISEFYLKNSWKDGKPTIEVPNPLYCEYSKSGNEAKVSKSDWFRETDEITLGQALDEYINILNQSDLEDLLHTGYQGRVPDKSDLNTLRIDDTQFQLAKQLYGGRFGQFYMTGTHESNNTNDWWHRRIRRNHFEFKAWDEMVFYTYTDEYNDTISVILENGVNIIPDHASKVEYTNEYFQKDYKWIWSDEFGNHEVIVKWIPQRYELTELGNSKMVQKRKVPFQPQNFEDPIGSFTLSYKGLVTNNLNAKACSRLESAIPPQLQILGVKQLQNKAISKYQGFVLGRDINQVPKGLVEDEKDVLTAIKVIEKQTGESYFASNNKANGFHNPQQGSPLIPMQLGDPNEFMILQRAIEMLDMEVGLNCGVSPAREGQIVQGTNVTDNQQSLIQTTLATEKDFYEHGQVWNEALNECLFAWDMYFKKYFEQNPDVKNTFLEHALPDGTMELIEILPEYTDSTGYGIYLTDTYTDQEYKQLMEAKLVQNTQDIDMATTSAISKAIKSGASAEEIHREIEILVGKSQEKQEQMQKYEAELREKAKVEQKEMMIYQAELEIEKAKRIAEVQQEGKERLAEIENRTFALQADIDQNMINDDIQKEEMKIKADKEKQLRDHKHEKEMLDKDIEGKIKIEKSKPKPQTKTTSK